MARIYSAETEIKTTTTTTTETERLTKTEIGEDRHDDIQYSDRDIETEWLRQTEIDGDREIGSTRGDCHSV